MKRQPPRLSPQQIAGIASLFASLAEPSRLCLLHALMDGPATVGELVCRTGLQQANASRHLAGLRGTGLLERRREGKFVRYSIRDPLVYRLCDLVCGKLKRDAKETVDHFVR